MALDTIVSHIQDETDIDSEERARETLKATLETFGERISREEGKDLARHLPDEIETWVIDWESEQSQEMSIDEFLERVAEELDVSEEQAQHYAQTAMAGVETHFTTEGTTELESARTQLPTEYDTLF